MLADWLVGWLAAAILNLQDTFIACPVLLGLGFGFCGLNAFDKFEASLFTLPLMPQSLLF